VAYYSLYYYIPKQFSVIICIKLNSKFLQGYMRIGVTVNIFGSWPEYWGANPQSAQIKGYSLIGKASCSW
jgi:hypothetical protein